MGLAEKQDKIDIAELMESIRDKVRNEINQANSALPDFKLKQADFGITENVKAGALTHCEDLLYLNRNHAVSNTLNPSNISSHRTGLLGKIIVKFKRKIAAVIRDSILKDYLDAQQQFLVHLVRHLNLNSRYVDARDSDLFWQVIHKIDTDVPNALERIERIREELLAEARSVRNETDRATQNLANQINSTLGKLLSEQEKHKSDLQTLDSVTRGLESILKVFAKNSAKEESANQDKATVPDLSYLLLENRFRGSEVEIAERQRFYIEYFKNCSQEKEILDVGCGRGELLEAFRTSGIKAKGIDMDAAMIACCKAKNLNVEISDLISYLRKAPDKSLGGLIALQVVEHLPREVLKEFIDLAIQKVEKDGIVIFETINPTSLTALSSNYFRDPTHVFPQHPDTLGFLMSSLGLEVVKTNFLSPISDQAKLRELPKEIYMTPKWLEMVDLFNHNINRLNELLYGYQDYCIVARVKS